MGCRVLVITAFQTARTPGKQLASSLRNTSRKVYHPPRPPFTPVSCPCVALQVAALVAKLKKLMDYTTQLVGEHNKLEARVEHLENLLISKPGSSAQIQK
jgi:hypothetical protein